MRIKQTHRNNKKYRYIKLNISYKSLLHSTIKLNGNCTDSKMRKYKMITALNNRELLTLLKTMNLNEMSEAYSYIEKGKKGMELPKMNSLIAKEFANNILELNKNAVNKNIVNELIDKLGDRIIYESLKSADLERGEKLREALMHG